MSEISKISLAKTAEQLTVENPSLVVAGSLGRAATMGVVVADIKPSGERRDIDVLRLGERSQELPSPVNGFKVDSVFERWIRFESNGVWLVFPYDENLAIEVPYADDVFAPRETEIDGSMIRVPPAQTLGAISTMQYCQRPKDKESMYVYSQYLSSQNVPTSYRRHSCSLLTIFAVNYQTDKVTAWHVISEISIAARYRSQCVAISK